MKQRGATRKDAVTANIRPKTKLQDLPEIWERQPGEKDTAFQAFALYRDMPAAERTIKRVGEKLGKRWCSYLEGWSSKYQWVERAAQYDAHLDREKLKAEKEDREKFRKLQYAMVRKMATKATERLTNLKPDELSPKDVREYVEAVIKLDRLTNNESTESVETYGKAGAPPAVQIYIPSNGRELTKKGDYE